MNLQDLRTTKTPSTLPSPHHKALWYVVHDDWDAAHRIVQKMNDMFAMWIHAALHRIEPDIWNAKYWYRNAEKPYPGDILFEDEVEEILKELIVEPSDP